MLAKNLSRIVCGILFLCCVAGCIFAMSIGHAGFTVTMLALSAILGIFVYTDIRKLLAESK